jgi:type VI secretion system protein ImpJ
MEPESNNLPLSDKVVWQEGMTLDPHHFQQWDRYQAALLNARVRSVTPFYWGVTQLEIDKDRLANGEFALLGCAGVMPDGLPIEIRGNLGNTPEARNIAKYPQFTPTKESLNVYLAIPGIRNNSSNVRLAGTNRHSLTRYQAQSTNVSDDNTGENERPIEVARLNVQLLLEGESIQGFTILQIAQIVRTGDGGYALSLRFSLTPLGRVRAGWSTFSPSTSRMSGRSTTISAPGTMS